MAGRFALYTDADVRGRLVEALGRAGWDVRRAVDAYPEGTSDAIHFDHAARERLVLVSNDSDMKVLAEQALARRVPFAGLVWWPRELYEQLSTGELLARFEALAAQDDPFGAYPLLVFGRRRIP